MSHRTLRRLLLLVLLAGSAQAATLYKWVDADGRVHYTDQPPAPGAKVTEARAAPSSAASGGADATLPYALRTPAARYPVTLYSSPECDACGAARAHLAARGVPFSEKLLKTTADVDAFRQLGFAREAVPALAVGREKTVGFEAEGWNRLLDAAGYPKTSLLPAGWKPAAAQPLAGERKAAATRAPDVVFTEPAGGEQPPFLPRRPVPAAAPSAAPAAPTTSIRF